MALGFAYKLEREDGTAADPPAHLTAGTRSTYFSNRLARC
jgi:hypothetical protein